MTDQQQLTKYTNLHKKTLEYIADMIDAEELMDAREAIDSAGRELNHVVVEESD